MMTVVTLPTAPAHHAGPNDGWSRAIFENGTFSLQVTIEVSEDTFCEAAVTAFGPSGDGTHVGVASHQDMATGDQGANIGFTTSGNDSISFGALDVVQRSFNTSDGRVWGPSVVMSIHCDKDVIVTEIREGTEVTFISTHGMQDDGLIVGERSFQASWAVTMESPHVHFASQYEYAQLIVALAFYHESEAWLTTPVGNESWRPGATETYRTHGPAGDYRLDLDHYTLGGDAEFIGMFLGLDD